MAIQMCAASMCAARGEHRGLRGMPGHSCLDWRHRGVNLRPDHPASGHIELLLQVHKEWNVSQPAAGAQAGLSKGAELPHLTPTLDMLTISVRLSKVLSRRPTSSSCSRFSASSSSFCEHPTGPCPSRLSQARNVNLGGRRSLMPVCQSFDDVKQAQGISQAADCHQLTNRARICLGLGLMCCCSSLKLRQGLISRHNRSISKLLHESCTMYEAPTC